jgi:hypothetical protein
MDSWTRSLAGEPPFCWMRDDVFQQYRRRVQSLIVRCRLLVACNPRNAAHILGWIAFSVEPFAIHFVWVKARYRRHGLGSDLNVLARVECDVNDSAPYTCHTRVVQKYELEEKWTVHYNPFLGPT